MNIPEWIDTDAHVNAAITANAMERSAWQPPTAIVTTLLIFTTVFGCHKMCDTTSHDVNTTSTHIFVVPLQCEGQRTDTSREFQPIINLQDTHPTPHSFTQHAADMMVFRGFYIECRTY